MLPAGHMGATQSLTTANGLTELLTSASALKPTALFLLRLRARKYDA